MRRHIGEKPQKKNPHELTKHQHVVSRRHLLSFAKGGLLEVSFWRDGLADWTSPLEPGNPVFCGFRAWDQRSEAFRFKRVEDRFAQELDGLGLTGRVSDHAAVTKYLLLWRFRGWWAYKDREALAVRNVTPSSLSQDEQELLEANGAAFLRPDGTMPDRLFAGLQWAGFLRRELPRLESVRWEQVHISGALLIGDAPAGLLVPTEPNTALVPRGYGFRGLHSAAFNEATRRLARRWVARAAPAESRASR